MNCQIIFYSMNNCHYCKKAETMFSEEISKGMMIKKSSSDAPQGSSGFPLFVAGDNKHVGLPSNKSELIQKLCGGVNAGSSPIIMFVMDGCSHCERALQVLSPNIASGQIKTMHHTMAPQGEFDGYPAFLSKEGKKSLGCPSNYSELLQKLGMVDKNYPLPNMKISKCGFNNPKDKWIGVL